MSDTYTCDKHGIKVPKATYCEACMETFNSRRDATTMTAQERADEFRWWGRILTIEFSDLHQRFEELVGRPVWTHELARPDLLIAEIERGTPSSFGDVLDKIPADKPVIVVKTD